MKKPTKEEKKKWFDAYFPLVVFGLYGVFMALILKGCVRW